MKHIGINPQLNPPACMHGRIHYTEPVNIKPQLIKSAQEVSSVQAQSCNTLNMPSVGNKMAIYCASVSVSQYVAFFLCRHVLAGTERGGELFIPSVLDARRSCSTGSAGCIVSHVALHGDNWHVRIQLHRSKPSVTVARCQLIQWKLKIVWRNDNRLAN